MQHQEAYRQVPHTKEAVVGPYCPDSFLSDSDKDKVAQELAVPLEKGSVVSIPYAATTEFNWVAIWQIDTRPEWQKFESSLGNCTLQEFDEALAEVVHRLTENKEIVDARLFGYETDGNLVVHCMSAKLPSEERLRRFKEIDLPALRCEFKMLWSPHRAPVEFTSDFARSDETVRTKAS